MTRASIRLAVAEAVADLTAYPTEKITDADDLFDDLGVDSMLAITLLVTIEDRLGATLPAGCEGRLVGVRTVAQLVDCLAAIFGATRDPAIASAEGAASDA
jgi:acyl carrier protein